MDDWWLKSAEFLQPLYRLAIEVVLSSQVIQHASTERGAVAFGRNVCKPASEEAENGSKMGLGGIFFAAQVHVKQRFTPPPPQSYGIGDARLTKPICLW